MVIKVCEDPTSATKYILKIQYKNLAVCRKTTIPLWFSAQPCWIELFE